jgi:hypothetical protein
MSFKVDTMRPRNLLILAVLWLLTLLTVAASFDWTSIILLAVMVLITYSSVRREMGQEYPSEPASDEPGDAGDE